MYHPFPLNRKPLTNYKLTPSTSNLALFSIEDLVIFQDSWQDETENGEVQRVGGGLQFGFVRFRFVSFCSVLFRFRFCFCLHVNFDCARAGHDHAFRMDGDAVLGDWRFLFFAS